jgi:hypothetical protein
MAISNRTLIQHTVFFKFPSIASEVPNELSEIVSNQFNSLPGIYAQLFPHGVGIEESSCKEEFLELVSWPDKTDGYTHCLLVIASDAKALKSYLHSDEHLKQWMPAVKPYIQGIIVFDNMMEESTISKALLLPNNTPSVISTKLQCEQEPQEEASQPQEAAASE